MALTYTCLPGLDLDAASTAWCKTASIYHTDRNVCSFSTNMGALFRGMQTCWVFPPTESSVGWTSLTATTTYYGYTLVYAVLGVPVALGLVVWVVVVRKEKQGNGTVVPCSTFHSKHAFWMNQELARHRICSRDSYWYTTKIRYFAGYNLSDTRRNILYWVPLSTN
jgi:hypothetical protein